MLQCQYCMSEHLFLLILFIVGVVSVIVFNFVVFFGAPFLPTRRQRVIEALDLLNLKPGQTLLELGSGDGRILREAARRGINAIGYELNPVLAGWSIVRSWKYRNLIKVRCRNYWLQPFEPADAIYTFLLQPYMSKLSAKVSTDISRPVKLVSFAFPIPDKKPIQDQNGLFLYKFKPLDK
jgi:hypothetical protein